MLSIPPLCDTLDLVHSLEALALRWCPFDRGRVTVSTFDFNNLYTNFAWCDLEYGLRYWKRVWRSGAFRAQCLEMECTFVDFMFTPASSSEFNAIRLSFPFLSLVHSVVCG